MKHFPIFLSISGRRIIVSGGGDAAMAKLRLLMKTEAHITDKRKTPPLKSTAGLHRANLPSQITRWATAMQLVPCFAAAEKIAINSAPAPPPSPRPRARL